MNPRLRLRRFRFEQGSNPGPQDQYVSALPTKLPGLLLFSSNVFDFHIDTQFGSGHKLYQHKLRPFPDNKNIR